MAANVGWAEKITEVVSEDWLREHGHLSYDRIADLLSFKGIIVTGSQLRLVFSQLGIDKAPSESKGKKKYDVCPKKTKRKFGVVLVQHKSSSFKKGGTWYRGDVW